MATAHKTRGAPAEQTPPDVSSKIAKPADEPSDAWRALGIEPTGPNLLRRVYEGEFIANGGDVKKAASTAIELLRSFGQTLPAKFVAAAGKASENADE